MTKTIPTYDPRGVVEASPLASAPRAKSLKGLRLGILDNTKWNANKLLRGVRDRLAPKHAFGAGDHYRKGNFSEEAQASSSELILREQPDMSMCQFTESKMKNSGSGPK